MSSILTFAGIALRNLFSPPVTSKYPFEPAVYPKASRGHVEINMNKCVFCGICSQHCPTETIKVDRTAKTWSMNRFDCVQCQNCVNVCPKSALTIVPGYFAPGVEKVSETFEKPAPLTHAVPALNDSKCVKCGWCSKKCPKHAITVVPGKGWSVNTSECIGCGLCAKECAFGAIEMEGAPAAAAGSGSPVAQVSMDKCKLCGLCAKNCPNEAISVDRKAKTWTLKAEDCVGCGACAAACHFDAITIAPAAAAPAAPAAEEKKEAAAPGTKVIALPGRRPVTIPLKADGEEAPVPGCIRPEYNAEFVDLPQCDRDKCKYCGLCMKKCPKSAIEVGRKEKFWEVDNAECVRCGVCAEACPFGALTI